MAGMNILLLHAEDRFEDLPRRHWDLVIDLARAPASSYARWAQRASCPVISLYDFAKEIEDVRHLRHLLKVGMSLVVDHHGIDWWDITSIVLAEQLLQLTLITRLASTLPASARLYGSRSCRLADALGVALGSSVESMSTTRLARLRSNSRHYAKVLSQSDLRQLFQSAFDKFDRQHRLRKAFAPTAPLQKGPFLLAPSAYINVSRTILSYAQAAPDQQFLLVHARRSGVLSPRPPNVCSLNLSGFFARPLQSELNSLLATWTQAKSTISSAAPEFKLAAATGILDQVPGILSWGIGVRDAWNRVLESTNISSCFCADNSNPYTRIPLILCKQRGIPSVACHHGALDFRMAFKTVHADRYLAKNEMELDYLRDVCGLESRDAVIVQSQLLNSHPTAAAFNTRTLDWLVFFTEPYGIGAWRSEEVHRSLLPPLARLARECGLQLIIKLHPFESLRHFNRLTRQLLSDGERARTRVISGAFSSEQWRRTSFAVAVESTIAIECSNRGIPIFLLAWLRNLSYGYLRQFQKFQVGRVVESPEEIADIPRRLREQESMSSAVRSMVPRDSQRVVPGPANWQSKGVPG
jgi:hypothetical protein